MDKLFLAIQEKLRSDVPEVKSFDWDNGQLDGENPTPPVTPIVLMDIDDIPFEQAGHMLSMGEMSLKIKCGFRIRGRSDSNAPESQQLTSLEFLTVLQNIGTALNGLRSVNTSPLQQDNLQRIQTDELKVYEYSFSCEYYETGKLRVYNTVERPPIDIKKAP